MRSARRTQWRKFVDVSVVNRDPMLESDLSGYLPKAQAVRTPRSARDVD